jgi:hypothetical protein
MNSKLQAKFLTMAAATLGLTLATGCAKKAEPAPAEGGESASGAESSCGAGSCGAAHADEKKVSDPVTGTEEPTTPADGAAPATAVPAK